MLQSVSEIMYMFSCYAKLKVPMKFYAFTQLISLMSVFSSYGAASNLCQRILRIVLPSEK